MSTLSEIARSRKPVEEVTAGLLAGSNHESAEAGKKLIARAKDAGLGLRDYLTLAVDVNSGAHAEANHRAGLNGYEAALSVLNLPFSNQFEQGVVLQAAADTFQTYSGTRALFPEVLDDMLRQQGRIDQIENTSAMVAQTRVIPGVEMISTVLNAPTGDDDGTFTVSELGRIPVRTIRTSQSSVKMYKHGSGYQFSYEFNRRASLDIVTPFASRVARQLEISKVAAATAVLVSGDGVNGAATAANLNTYGWIGTTGKSLKDNYRALAAFIMTQWKAGYMIDTLLVNFDMYVELMFMFTPTLAGAASEASVMPSFGTPAINLPIMGGNINVVLSSSMAANTLLAYVKGETLEELQESGSNIAESERSIENQSILYVKSEVTGYKLAFGDTRFLVTVPATT